MPYQPANPLIVQGDRSLLLEVDHPLYESARDALARFAELEKSPEHIHTYRLSPLSLWNAAAAGMSGDEILESLRTYSKYDIPQNVETEILDYVSRFGCVKLLKQGQELVLYSEDPLLITEITHHRNVQPWLDKRLDEHTVRIPEFARGHLKQALIKIGFPAEDLAGYVQGATLDFALKSVTREKKPFRLRKYQMEAADIFHAGGGPHGGSGVIVLPCGAGKTIVGIGVMLRTRCDTLILSTNTVAVRQWIQELLDKTDLTPEQIGEYTGDRKEIRPVTIATYQILTYRPRSSEDFVHLGIFSDRNWGLIIYDEVHLLPAPIFRITAEIQARRRLGLTATLVREDGREDDVFSLIGPKKYDVPWKTLEQQGWIATAHCYEIRVALPHGRRMEYAVAETRQKFRIASENPAKDPIVEKLVRKHRQDQVLVIGQYLDQLRLLATQLDAPLITGKTTNRKREKLYEQFRTGEIKLLVVSKVANFAIDLPDANVAIQVSGTFGSRQEEAQRLGRILRPKSDGSLAHFYSIVTRDSRDQEFAVNRQLFLTEQGYKYIILDADSLDKLL